MTPAPQPRVVIKSAAVRDTIVAALFVIVIVAVLVWGMTQLGKREPGNTLTGEIVAKEFTPMKEQIIEFKGRSLKSARESDGEYVLKVRVDGQDGRVFDVPVPQGTYLLKKEGDSMTFVRPPSEQK